MYTHNHQSWKPEPPFGISRQAEREFRRLNFRMQIFIYLKYVLHREKKYIMKYLFIRSEYTYYKLLLKVRQYVQNRYDVAN